jgi:hypothetical protein
LGEILNVGILVYFPEDKLLEFAHGDGTRVKAIYPKFNNALFNSYFKAIQNNINKAFDLFSRDPYIDSFFDFIHKNILSEDAAGLVFSQPSQIPNVFNNKEIAISEISKLFLPGIDIIKPKIEKRNENYIIREFTQYLLGGSKEKLDRLVKEPIIKTNHFEHKFSYSWNFANTTNYIKPISFDLSSEIDISTKAAQHVGYLTDLQNYGVQLANFDFLIAKPLNKDLNSSYQNALDFIDSVKISKKLIFEDKIQNYTQEIFL